MSLAEDCMVAQRVVSGIHFNFWTNSLFGPETAIYKISNERTEEYYHHLVNKEKVLSVIASGDQILNMILEGSKEIDAFDISTFPKYFLYLKIAAILTFTREDYLDFFYDLTKDNEVYDEMYDDLCVNLTKDSREFWNSLFNFFDWKDIYGSTLFYSEVFFSSTAVRQNKFLQSDEYYEELRRKLKDIIINTYECNIYKSASMFKKKYNLVYLSNIFFYNDLSDYKKLLGNLTLAENGIALTYLHSLNEKVKQYFEDLNVSYEQFDNSDAGVMIYRK